MPQIQFEYGLLGRTLSHSFSARYFADKFAREGIGACYLNFELAEIAQLPVLIRKHPLLRGLNVTIPYKQAVIPYLDSLSDTALEAGAVNTILLRPDGSMHGHNTDVEGLRLSLLPMLPADCSGLRALILGSGGASRAAKVVLRSLEIPYTLVSRFCENRPAVQRCASTARPHGSMKSATHDEAEVRPYTWLSAEVIHEHRLIINATPAGTWPSTEEMPPLPVKHLSDRHIIQDLIYNPPLTRLMQEALTRGARVCNGLHMLHAQAEAAWKIWQEG